MYFTWKKLYETGLEEIDNQHKKFLTIINDLHKELTENKDFKTVEAIINELKSYAEYHFKTEEKLFEQYNYKGEELSEHLKKHKDFENFIEKAISNISSSKSIITTKLADYARKWLIEHICGTDVKFVKFINQNN
jgi:hemerythrin-like metal-binding protein